jgi:hypothetical protein
MDIDDDHHLMDIDGRLLQDGASLTSLYLASLPSSEVQTLISSVPASEQARQRLIGDMLN